MLTWEQKSWSSNSLEAPLVFVRKVIWNLNAALLQQKAWLESGCIVVGIYLFVMAKPAKLFVKKQNVNFFYCGVAFVIKYFFSY